MQAGTSSRKESNEAEKQRIAQYTNELIRADANKALGRTEPASIIVRGVGNWEDCSLLINESETLFRSLKFNIFNQQSVICIQISISLENTSAISLSAFDVKQTCKEVKECLSELLLDYDEYTFHSTTINNYCESLEESAEAISLQFDHGSDEKYLSHSKL